MPEYSDVFALNGAASGPGDDFESRVFAKIRKKKMQRKVGMGVAALAGAVMLLSLFQLLRPLPRRLPLSAAGGTKEVVPVSENLYFSASDSRIRYSLEPVAYGERSGKGEGTLNQI